MDALPPSIEEDLVNSLSTQLALQQELCKQYEVDLCSRDETVSGLREKLNASTRDLENRKSVIRVWRKKVTELEHACRYLEDQVDRRMQDSMEHSTLEEASREALRMLHERINALESEKREVDGKVDILRAELAQRDESERDVRQRINFAHANIDSAVGSGEASVTRVPSNRGLTEVQLDQTGGKLEDGAQIQVHMRVAELEQVLAGLVDEKSTLLQQSRDSASSLARYERELAILKAELEAQWKNTEESSATVNHLRQEQSLLQKERDCLRQELELLDDKANMMESEWMESENRRAELEESLHDVRAAKDEAERERDTVSLMHLCYCNLDDLYRETVRSTASRRARACYRVDECASGD